MYEVAKLNTKWPRTSNEVVPNFEQSSPRTSYEVFQRSLLQHEDIFSAQYMNVLRYMNIFRMRTMYEILAYGNFRPYDHIV